MTNGATLDAVRDLLVNVQGLVEQVLAGQPLSPNSITIVQGLSDIDENLGIVVAGEFRTGNGHIPGDGFSGVRMAYPAMTYDSAEWNIAGVENDVLQFGLRASDGAALAGAGSVVLDVNGITISGDGTNLIQWVDAVDMASAGVTIIAAIGGGLSTWELDAGGPIVGEAGWVKLAAYDSGGGLSGYLLMDGSPVSGPTVEITAQSGSVLIQGVDGITLTGPIITSNNITMASTKWIGLGAAAGRFVFTDAATDDVNLQSATFTVDNYISVSGVNSGTDAGLNMSRTGTVGIYWDNGTRSFKEYLASGGNKLAWGSGGVDFAILDFSAATFEFGAADSQGMQLQVHQRNSGTNTVLAALLLDRYTSGTAAASLGVSMVERLESDSGAIRNSAEFESIWATAADATRKARAFLRVYDTAAREAIRLEASGTAAMLGFYGVAAIARPSAWTQTYATTSKTVANITAVNPAAYGAGANGYSTAAMAAAVHAEVIALRADIVVIKNNLNSLIDDLQALGLAQ